ncbi:kinase-like domain-containing protein [Pyrenochaeta sp. MPI-SDFR-AT-0127]|nr:kinase-like domain-containing protein [Pyrenochaeta sp. MPI-SDFR-AT-0127]
MFRWYRNSTRSYVYLSDVSTVKQKANDQSSECTWEPAFRGSRWFTRCWTLQDLLAPRSVEFFSQEGIRLGDRGSLTRQIYEITGIPESALQGTPLSHFSVKDRFEWTGYRQAKLEEDKAYSLLGIFDVEIPLRYGEGMASAFKRLEEEIDKRDKCIQDLHLTDPRDDKKRIEEAKGGLLEDSYYWILENSDFQRWRNDPQSRLLWIKGKGKTMLLCGIINELSKSTANTEILSYFFCQATDSRINSATAVLRGLLYMLVSQQPSLTSHIRKKHNYAGKALFNDANAWVALSEIFTNILQDPDLTCTYVFINALDECVVGLSKLLDFIAQKSCISSRVKWIVSSCNDANIERRLRLDNSGAKLSLELEDENTGINSLVDSSYDMISSVESTLGQHHANTLNTVHWPQQLQSKSSSLLPANTNTQYTLAGRLDSFFIDERNYQQSYNDSEICEISTLLKHSNPPWSKVPRTYTILRTIGYLKFLDDLIDVGFSDYWLPVTERNLPGCLQPRVRAAFVGAQSLVLTKSMDLERGGNGQHCHFKQGEPLPFEPKGILGSGGFGQVDKVLSQISFKEYARKRVLRSTAFASPRKEYTKQFIAEIQILKRLEHHHIVEFVGSYTDPKYIGLIMSPVADMNLGAYLKQTTVSNRPELRTFFGCLATALEFLHEQKVRHKDIKPGNILIHRSAVLFADFGLSLDFTDTDGSTTMSMVNGMSPRYCAPEVARQEPRNTTSDIWSLGVVFMEMIVVLKGRTAEYMIEFFGEHGSRQTFIRTNLAALSEFILELEGIEEVYDNRALAWAQQMLLEEPDLRLTASSLVASIRAFSKEGVGTGFCGICCASPEDGVSDWSDG